MDGQLQLYLTQQHPGYASYVADIEYNQSSGIIPEETYREYVERHYDHTYNISWGILSYNTGLMPRAMKFGLEEFLRLNKSDHRSVTWPPYSIQGKAKQKQSVLNEIETMLNEDIPVVFSYYDMAGKILRIS